MLKKWLPVLMVLGALPAGATTTYNTLSAMQSANPGLAFTAVDFNAPGLPANLYTSGQGVTFQESSGQLATQPTSGWTGLVLAGVTKATSISITLPSGATAFGGYFGTAGGTWGTVDITAVGNTTITQTVNFGAPQYWGFVSSTPFTSITVSVATGDAKPGLNTFVFGSPASGGSDVPEPSTFALMGGALTVFPLLARRLRK